MHNTYLFYLKPGYVLVGWISTQFHIPCMHPSTHAHL